MKKAIKLGSREDHKRMKPRHPSVKASKNAQIALREQLDAWVRVIIANPQKAKPIEFWEAKKGILEYAQGGENAIR